MSKKSCNFAAEIENDDDDDNDNDNDNDDDDDNDNDNENIIEMKKSILLMLAMVVSVGMMAVPARRGWQEKTQPDGTTIKVMMVGDEFYHYYINENGERIAQGEDGERVAQGEGGWWQVVEKYVSPDSIAARRARNPMLMSRSEQDEAGEKANVRRAPMAVGTKNLAPRGLLILVNFADSKFQDFNSQEEMNKMMNAETYTYNNAQGSAREYFKAQSNGQYIPDFDVVGPVTVANNVEYYGKNNASDNDIRPGQLIAEACKLADSQFGVDFTKYDNDKDGEVDFVYVIYAGKGEADGGGENTIWPHNWELSSAGIAKSNRTFDGKVVDNYACSAELDGLAAKLTRAGIGTFCHEFGHVLGLPDFYDTKYATNYENGLTPGAWDIMDYGSYNDDGKCPPNYSPWEKYFFGWAKPTCLKDTGDVTLTAAYDDFYQLNSAGTVADWSSTETQYYIENRQKNGWDKGLPHHGMLIWQVKYDATCWDNNTPNNTSNSPRYTIISANGDDTVHPNTSEINYEYYSEGSKTVFPGTEKVTEWRGVTDKPILDIQEREGNIYFSFIENRSFYTYDIVYDHATVSSEGGEVLNGATFTVTIEPEEGYVITEKELDVEMGGTVLTMGEGYTYADNVLTIPNVSDNIEIIVDPVPATPSAIQQAQKGVRARKILVGGELYIVVDGVRMDAMGRKM